MKKAGSSALLAVVILASPLAARSPRQSQPSPSSVRRFVQADAKADMKEHMRNEAWLVPIFKAARYIAVTLGNREYIYNLNGKFIKVKPARWPTAGIIGSYAEVGSEFLNSKMQRYSDNTFGSAVIRFNGSGWRVVAWDNSAEGYGDTLRSGKVPRAVIRKLRRWASGTAA